VQLLHYQETKQASLLLLLLQAQVLQVNPASLAAAAAAVWDSLGGRAGAPCAAKP
jgi:hypothetical protein